MKEGTEPRKVQISILTDKNDKDLIRQIRRNGAIEIALSPDAKEVAFILRGDVYVTSVEYKTTKQSPILRNKNATSTSLPMEEVSCMLRKETVCGKFIRQA